MTGPTRDQSDKSFAAAAVSRAGQSLCLFSLFALVLLAAPAVKSQSPASDVSKDYVRMDFPPGAFLAEILYPVQATDRTGKTGTIMRRTVARGSFVVSKTIPLNVLLHADAVNNMQYIEKLKVCNVNRVDASDLDMEDKNLTYLKDFKHLEQLDLYSTLVTDKCLAQVAKISTLISLRLNRTAITGEGFKYLPQLKQLGNLSIANIALKKGVLASTVPCGKSLLGLDVGHSGLSKEDLAQIKHFPKLTYLDISFNNEVDNSAIKLLAGFNHLETLHVEDTHVNEQCMPLLLKLPALQKVYVRNKTFWLNGHPPKKNNRLHFIDVGTTEGNTLELLAPLH